MAAATEKRLLTMGGSNIVTGLPPDALLAERSLAEQKAFHQAQLDYLTAYTTPFTVTLTQEGVRTPYRCTFRTGEEGQATVLCGGVARPTQEMVKVANGGTSTHELMTGVTTAQALRALTELVTVGVGSIEAVEIVETARGLGATTPQAATTTQATASVPPVTAPTTAQPETPKTE